MLDDLVMAVGAKVAGPAASQLFKYLSSRRDKVARLLNSLHLDVELLLAGPINTGLLYLDESSRGDAVRAKRSLESARIEFMRGLGQARGEILRAEVSCYLSLVWLYLGSSDEARVWGTSCAKLMATGIEQQAVQLNQKLDGLMRNPIKEFFNADYSYAGDRIAIREMAQFPCEVNAYCLRLGVSSSQLTNIAVGSETAHNLLWTSRYSRITVSRVPLAS